MHVLSPLECNQVAGSSIHYKEECYTDGVFIEIDLIGPYENFYWSTESFHGFEESNHIHFKNAGLQYGDQYIALNDISSNGVSLGSGKTVYAVKTSYGTLYGIEILWDKA